jgi:hypothetical protein
MPPFKVGIGGDGPQRALASLQGASIPTIRPTFTWFGDPGRHRSVIR